MMTGAKARRQRPIVRVASAPGRMCALRGQSIRCSWVAEAGDQGEPGVLRVTLVHPRRPAILAIEAMDELVFEDGTCLRVRAFLPSRGRLVRGGLVLLEDGI